MKKIAFIISSRFGYTYKIGEYLAKEANSITMDNSGNGYDISYFDLERQNFDDLTRYDLIVVGASVRYGHFHSSLLRFAEHHAPILNQQKTAFYTVNLVARKTNKDKPESNSYTRKFLKKSPWEPNLVAVFAGELNYSQYNFLDKQIIRFIMKLTGGDTDIKSAIEYTNWQAVKLFGYELIRLLEDSDG